MWSSEKNDFLYGCACVSEKRKMAASDKSVDDSLYPIAVLIDELKNEDVQVSNISYLHVINN